MSKPPLIKTNLVLFVGLPVAALILVPLWGLYHGYDAFQWWWAVAILYLNGMSITGGYHRLWAHKSYEAHPALRWFFALWGAGALQNSILVWASDHRRHHRHVDDNAHDPYSAGRGLWFSHMGWMLRDYPTNADDFSNVQDLQRDPVVMFQHRHYVTLTWLMNLAPPLLLGWWHGDMVGTFLLVGLLRLVVNHHVTFFINSLAHYWGSRPYTEDNSARDNAVLAFLTYGEGYHNYHHMFQTDYRNGIRWWQWDPTKWLINLCSRVGLASNLTRVADFRVQRTLLDTAFKRARSKLDAGRDSETLRQVLEREYQLFTQSINQWRSLQTARYERSKEQLGEALVERREILLHKWDHMAPHAQLKSLESALRMQRKRLQLLMEQVRMHQAGLA